MSTLAVGDRVKLTAKFLRLIEQYTGDEGTKVFTVIGFERDWAIVNEPTFDLSDFTPAELEADPTLKWRRIGISNLKKIAAFFEK